MTFNLGINLIQLSWQILLLILPYSWLNWKRSSVVSVWLRLLLLQITQNQQVTQSVSGNHGVKMFLVYEVVSIFFLITVFSVKLLSLFWCQTSGKQCAYKKLQCGLLATTAFSDGTGVWGWLTCWLRTQKLYKQTKVWDSDYFHINKH